MIEDNFSDSEGDFDVLCNVESVLLVKYDVVTEVADVEEIFYVEEMDDHKPVCYYILSNDYVEENHFIFEKPDLGMKSHFKPLFIKAKFNNYVVNKVLVDSGAIVNMMLCSLLRRIRKFDTDLRPHNIVLSNYEGKIDHSLGGNQGGLGCRE